MFQRALICITLLLFASVALATIFLDPERLSALGGILSGAGSLLAVLWFSAGLRYQSRQLEEQRKQFAAQFQFLRESSRREALRATKEVLRETELHVYRLRPDIKTLASVTTAYAAVLKDVPEIVTSTDPDVVFDSSTRFLLAEMTASTLLTGIKAAAELYLRSGEEQEIDFRKSPEEFYAIYNPLFRNLPFFSSLVVAADLLVELMLGTIVARRAVSIANRVAILKVMDSRIVNTGALLRSIEELQEDGYPIPAIAAKEV